MADKVVYINLEEGVKRVMNNLKLYVKLLVKFRDGTNLEDLDTALATEDWEKAQNIAHTIKGVAANLSFSELFNQSLELENQIKAKSVKPGQFEILKEVFTHTMQEVEKVIAENG